MIRLYRTEPEFSSWGLRRRASRHIEITLGRVVITTEPK